MENGAGYWPAIAGTFGDVSPGRTLLVTDFDGTLAEITSQPEAAVPRPGALAALRALVASLQHVALVSGRTTAALGALVPVAGVELLGDYGLTEPDPAELAALASFNRLCEAHLGSMPGARLEAKAASSSVHHRARPELAEPVWALVSELAGRAGLRASRGRMVVEVRPERGDKGRTLIRLLSREHPLGLIVMGDDEGDRSMFEVAAAQPIAHLVVGVTSPEAPAGLFERCDLSVPGPAGAEELLRTLVAWSAGRAPSGPGAGARSSA